LLFSFPFPRFVEFYFPLFFILAALFFVGFSLTFFFDATHLSFRPALLFGFSPSGPFYFNKKTSTFGSGRLQIIFQAASILYQIGRAHV
jgi:hypothetical protein